MVVLMTTESGLLLPAPLDLGVHLSALASRQGWATTQAAPRMRECPRPFRSSTFRV